MFAEIKLPFLIVIIFCLELIIYLWSVFSASLKDGNYFSISKKLVFEKCARNSGRISAILNLIILLMIGYWGLKKIYTDAEKFNLFLNIAIIFTINHLIHFLYITQNFKRKSKSIKLSDEKHGIFTFACITVFPIVLWYFKNLNTVLYIFIILHLCNVSYVFIDVLYNKVRVKAIVTYHNKIGIIATILAWVYIAISFFVKFYFN
jgi:hypothetical protein